ncbi:hypothetical protein M378DRAFT_7918 [Amanita muscaria Koide BX008]|uniref:Uncharacterized protein n=1 Tax=Amanita muscaria (strain Koide BX008) TaxID=946122 RepID=A0A0C2X4P0_AMAMK|nr:hypothetical protein M378DRAFT_7918 [Amanita muscaria Koide BX008]
MGRTLFSQNYSTPPSPQAVPDTWSKSNPFDPDSDDFFIDAVYEAFLDPSEYQRQQQNATLTAVVLPDDDEENVDNRTPIIMQIDSDRDSGVSLSSGSPLLSSRGSPSPMAVGADDPAVILADAGYTDVTVRPEWRRARASMAATYESWLRMGRPVSSVLPIEAASPPPPTGYIPPLTMDDDEDDIGPLPIQPDLSPRINRPRSSSIIAAQDRLATQPLTRSNPIPINRRTVSITPIDITPLDRRPSPAPRSPSATMAILQTPPRSRDTSQMTPSPASTVIPRIYTWHSTATAPRPSTSPLTNPNARISHSRINITPVHMRMQSAAVSP